MRITRLLASAGFAAFVALPASAQGPKHEAVPHEAGSRDLADTVPPHPLPAPVTTDQTIDPPGRTLHFKATAGAVRLSDAASGAPIADIGFTYYKLDGTETRKRPLAIALNGGPGASSAWLDIGAIGPWRLPVKVNDISPAAAPDVVGNAEDLARFRGSALHRPARHRLQPRARQGRGREDVLFRQRRHRLARHRDTQMARRQ